MQGLRPLFLLLSRLAPKQASASRLRRRNSLRASGLHHSKKNHENRLARPLCPTKKLRTFKLTKLTSGLFPQRAADLTGSGPSRRDSLFSWFSFVSAPRFDAGESAIVGVEGGERRASHKSSAPTMAEGLSPWRWHKGVFLVLVSKNKMHWICRVRRYFLEHHIEHPTSLPMTKIAIA